MPPDQMVERRSKPRIAGPISATLCGSDRSGELFQIETILDNLSMTGLQVRLKRELQVGASLCALIRLAGMEVATNGIVSRVIPQPEGWFGFGVAFEGYRFASEESGQAGGHPGSEA